MVNKAELRQFITQYFSDLELDELCFDYYPDLLNQFTSGMTKSQKVIALIGYCDRRGLTNHLLTTLAKLRPAAYQDQFGLVPKPQASTHAAGRNPNQIFLSHSSQDAAFARELAGDLRQNGFDIWMAPESIEPGEKWVDAIERGLETSGIFVLVITPHAADSKWVRDESNYAIALQNKDEMRFFTLLVGEGRMPPMWSVRQHISFREDYDEGLLQLLAALSPDRFAARPVPPPAAPTPPLVEPTEAPPPAESKPAARKPRAPAARKTKPETPPATEVEKKPEVPTAKTATTPEPVPMPANTESLKPAQPVQASVSIDASSVVKPPIDRAPDPVVSKRLPVGPIIAPDPTPESPATKPARGKTLYWAMGLVAVVAVAFLGWRLIAAGADGDGDEISGVTPVNRSGEEDGVTTDPTLTPTRTPAPTRTPTTTPAQPPAQAGEIRTVSRGDVEVEQAFVPAGSFMMGSENGKDDEGPVHEVALDAFWIDRTEVTNAQFEMFVADTGYQTTAEREGGGYTYTNNNWDYTEGADWLHPQGAASTLNGLSQHPVVLVSWDDATEFCEWASGRLPTEAEWEYAARGPESLAYPWGAGFDGTRLNFCDRNCPFDYADQSVDDGYEFTAPVMSYTNGASWIGAQDMAGNVWEWVEDWYGDYGSLLQKNPEGPSSGEYRVLRGGAWSDYSGDFNARSSNRNDFEPDYHYDFMGFRCAQD